MTYAVRSQETSFQFSVFLALDVFLFSDLKPSHHFTYVFFFAEQIIGSHRFHITPFTLKSAKVDSTNID